MLKEIKYLIFVLVILLFIFFTGKYYFSDENKKNFYRSFNNINEKINIYSSSLPLLKNNTNNVEKPMPKEIEIAIGIKN